MTSEFRKLSGDARRWRKGLELASERLPQILNVRKVDADGAPPLSGEGYKVL